MNDLNYKSIIIEGDKTLFSSKAAIDRLKRDLREDNKEKLAINNYLNEGWTFKIISNTDTQIKIELIPSLEIPNDTIDKNEVKKLFGLPNNVTEKLNYYRK